MVWKDCLQETCSAHLNSLCGRDTDNEQTQRKVGKVQMTGELANTPFRDGGFLVSDLKSAVCFTEEHWHFEGERHER